MHGLIWPEYAVRRSWKVLRLHRWTDIGTRFHILAFYLEGRRSQWKVLSKFNDQLSSVAQSCLTLCDPMDCSTPGLPGHHQLPEFTQTHVHWVGDAIQHLILCCPLLLLSPIPPSIRVFSNESTLLIIQFSHPVVLDSLRPHESWHARPPCPSPTPRVHSDSRVAIQPSHPLSSPSSPAPNPSQHQSLFQWVSSSHDVAKVLEFQL